MGRVSVALATYNGAAFLAQQLESLQRQTLVPHELVVNDDASSDATWEILSAFASRAPFPVRLQRNPERLGHIDNFFTAAARCTGEFVAFCDQDDVWLPHKLERCVAALDVDGGPSLVVHSAEVVDEDLRPVGYRLPDVSDGRFAPGHGAPGAQWLGFALCFERRLLSLIPLRHFPRTRPEDQPGHDTWVCFLAAMRGGTQFVGEPLVLYRQHAGNVFGVDELSPQPRPPKWFDLSADRLVQRADSADFWASVIERTRRAGDLSTDAYNADAWERTHRDLARALRARARLYDGRPTRRVATLARLGAARAYRAQSKGGLGARAAAKDVAVGLIGAQRIARAFKLRRASG
jgi:glycosyltransferase involved in cell wall biosynthesis